MMSIVRQVLATCMAILVVANAANIRGSKQITSSALLELSKDQLLNVSKITVIIPDNVTYGPVVMIQDNNTPSKVTCCGGTSVDVVCVSCGVGCSCQTGPEQPICT
jgi:hypothetical protein